MVCPMYVRCGCRPDLVLIPPVTGWDVFLSSFLGVVFLSLVFVFVF